MTIVAIGAHPDDPEEGAGGTLARFTALQNKSSKRERLVIVYVTSGGAGIAGPVSLLTTAVVSASIL